MNIVLIDNYDSFTYNLYDLIYRVSGVCALVIRNDALSFKDFETIPTDCIVLSPGPGHPGRREDFGISSEVLSRIEKPILGICLGHQGIAEAFGGEVVRAPEPAHGLVEAINHEGTSLFEGVPQRVKMVRYHSLVVKGDLPQTLKKTAWTDDGLVMGIQHCERPIFGVQFHPESICSEYGDTLITNFLRIAVNEVRIPSR
jgi:anthranilate synthase/aminodeoxychorismate synthase-like glutamine amidotransferase